MTSYLFSVLLVVSLLAGMRICEARATDPAMARGAYLAGVWGGIVGARLWFALQYGDFSPIGGWASWGFVIGGSLGSVIWLRWRLGRCAFGDFADAVAPALAAGGALMRIGCFFIGCNFGKVTSLPWAIRYPAGQPAFEQQLRDGLLSPAAPFSLPVHPTQLYESAALLLILWGMLRIPPRMGRKLLPGELFFSGVLLYGAFRFGVEFLRADAGGVHFGLLTFAQATSILAILVSLSVMLWRRRFFDSPAPNRLAEGNLAG